MKWVLVYIIMTTTHGSTSFTIEFDGEEGCKFAKSIISLAMLMEKPRGAVVVSECILKGRH